jgi:hypothetical protein
LRCLGPLDLRNEQGKEGFRPMRRHQSRHRQGFPEIARITGRGLPCPAVAAIFSEEGVLHQAGGTAAIPFCSAAK